MSLKKEAQLSFVWEKEIKFPSGSSSQTRLIRAASSLAKAAGLWLSEATPLLVMKVSRRGQSKIAT